ncbi:MAG: hypothetical protein ABFR62_02235 [Bacteroidota bacterium]
MKYSFLLLFNFLFVSSIFSQVDSITKFYYKDGTLSSEGYLRNGKPDGYWKTYYQNGKLKSEGNRNFYQLDGLWKFYDTKGFISQEINYKDGIREGEEKFYKQGVLFESVDFVKNIKEGKSYRYYPDGKINYEVNYVNNEIFGKGYEFDTIGNIITIESYSSGVLSRTQRINRSDVKNDKHGLWVWFDDDRRVTLQGTYKHGLKHGYFKTYDKKGNLVKTTKYINGEIQEDAIETAKLEVKRTYYSDKKLKSYKSYRNGVPDGVHQEFDASGKTNSTVLYKLGIVVAKGGLLDEKGKRQGVWTEFFMSGEKKSEGKFVDGKKDGIWKFFFEDGEVEQLGSYKSGKAIGEWTWYYDDGNILRLEGFINGKEEGESVEYDRSGNIVAKGEYIEGQKEGEWFYITDKYRHEGGYEEGMKTGNWKQIHITNDKIVSETYFYEGLRDGDVKYYYDNGIIKVEGNFESGLKQGDWNYYNEQGAKTLTVKYSAGVDVKYDNIETVEL